MTLTAFRLPGLSHIVLSVSGSSQLQSATSVRSTARSPFFSTSAIFCSKAVAGSSTKRRTSFGNFANCCGVTSSVFTIHGVWLRHSYGGSSVACSWHTQRLHSVHMTLSTRGARQP